MASERASGPPVSIRAMSADEPDLQLFHDCFTKNGSPRPVDLLRWQYLANPTGSLFVDFAVSQDRLAAIYASMPVAFRIAGERRLGIQSVDTMTDADFRGRGLFVKLAQRTYQRATDAGVALVYGLPNANSAHGFFKRLEWKELGLLPFLIRPLRTRYFLRRLGAGAVATWLPDLPVPVGFRPRDVSAIDRFDDRVSAVWDDFARDVGIAVERDARYLNWRLVDRPDETYRNLVTSDGDAFASHCVKEKERSRVGYIMDAFCRRGRERALRRVMRASLIEMAERRADFVLAWCFPHSSTYATYLRAGFIPLPRRMWPLEIHFGARAFASNVAATVDDRRNWYISFADNDTV